MADSVWGTSFQSRSLAKLKIVYVKSFRNRKSRATRKMKLNAKYILIQNHLDALCAVMFFNCCLYISASSSFF